MKLIALIRKEFREALPWLALAAVAMLIFGGLALQTLSLNADRYYYIYQNETGKVIDSYQLIRRSPLTAFSPLLVLVSCGLGLALAGRQFWMPNFTRTWAFTLHRSVRRSTVLTAKLLCALIVLALGVVLPWGLFFMYAGRDGFLPIPPGGELFLEGCVLISMGLLGYLGAATAGVSRARWYGTKLFSVAFALLGIMAVALQISLVGCFAAAGICSVIMAAHLFYSFIHREY